MPLFVLIVFGAIGFLVGGTQGLAWTVLGLSTLFAIVVILAAWSNT